MTPTDAPAAIDDLCARLERLSLDELLLLRDAIIAVPRESSDRAHTAALAAAWKADRLPAFYAAGERASLSVMRAIAGGLVELTARRMRAASSEELEQTVDDCKREGDELVEILVEAAGYAGQGLAVVDLVPAEDLVRPFGAVERR